MRFFPTMKENAARQRFIISTEGPDQDIDLAEACFWISAEVNPKLDVEHYKRELAALAENLRPRIPMGKSIFEKVLVLNQVLFTENQFRGNQDDYYDPRNSYLDRVFDLRIGNPIMLSILYMAVARRLGIPTYGVGFPGHFMVGAETDPPSYIDAFSGTLLSVEDCRVRLREIAGGDARFDSRMLAPVSHRHVLARVLRNLKQIFAQSSDYQNAIACSDRILILEPDHASEFRDRGLLHRAMGCWSFAREDLERFVQIAPDAPEVEDVGVILEELRVRSAQIH